jgi:hypothetical protein
VQGVCLKDGNFLDEREPRLDPAITMLSMPIRRGCPIIEGLIDLF